MLQPVTNADVHVASRILISYSRLELLSARRFFLPSVEALLPLLHSLCELQYVPSRVLLLKLARGTQLIALIMVECFDRLVNYCVRQLVLILDISCSLFLITIYKKL